MRHFLLLLVLALALAGCGAAASTPTPALPEPSGAVRLMAFGDPQEQQAYTDLLTAFMAKYPQVQATLEFVPYPNQYRAQMDQNFGAGTPADVLIINYRRSIDFAAQGLLAPLTSYIAQTPSLDTAAFFPQALAAFQYGEQYCLPQSISPLLIYYNKALFAAAGLPEPTAGWRWDDFLQAARTLTSDSDDDGIIDQYGLGTEAALYRVLPFIWSSGGEIVDAPTKPTRLTFDNPQTRAALEWFIALQQTWHVTPNPVQEQLEPHESRFVHGRLGMFMNSYRGVASYRQIADLDWDVVPLPVSQRAASILHSEGYCMAQASSNKLAAWALIAFASSPAGQRIVAEGGRTIPALRAEAERLLSAPTTEPPQHLRAFLDSIADTRPMPTMPRWLEVEQNTDLLLEYAFHGDMTLDQAITQIITLTQPAFDAQGAGK